MIAPEVEAVVRFAARLEAIVAQHLDRTAPGNCRDGRTAPRQLLSLRAAARLIGVDRGTTLRGIIDGRRLRTVTVMGNVR